MGWKQYVNKETGNLTPKSMYGLAFLYSHYNSSSIYILQKTTKTMLWKRTPLHFTFTYYYTCFIILEYKKKCPIIILYRYNLISRKKVSQKKEKGGERKKCPEKRSKLGGKKCPEKGPPGVCQLHVKLHFP